jgi:peptide/nickel transport system substrate-binding protein
MRPRWAIALVVAMTTAFGMACSGAGSPSSASSGGIIPQLNAGTTQGYSTLDPYKTTGCNALYCALMLEHLLDFDSTGKLQPQLATSWEQTNPITYVYHLRHGVTFWDGSQMTSADVVNALNYDRSPGSNVQFAFGSVQSVTASDQYTVVVTLTKPDAGFKYSVSYEGPIFEKSFQDAHRDTMGNPGVLIQGTGPWKPDSFDPTTGLELSANPHWWGGKVPIQHISYRFYADEKSEALAMRAGDVDVAFPADGRTFAATSGGKVIGYPFNNFGYFAMNVKVAPWNDLHLRRAVAYALNRTDIIAATGGPQAASPIYADIPAFDLDSLATKSQVDTVLNGLPQYRFDLAKAKQELAQSAYPNGVTARLDVNNYGAFPNVAQVIAAELAKIGVTLDVNVVTSAQMAAEEDGPHTYGVLFSTLYAVPPDPSLHASYLFGSDNGQPVPYNFASYTSPELDGLLNAGLSTGDGGQRLNVYGEILKQASADVPYVPLYQVNAYTAVSSKFTMPPDDIWQGFIPWPLEIKATGQS